MMTGRDAAFALLRRWVVLEDPPFLPERGDPQWADLSPRERGSAFELLAGIIRWRGTLDVIIGGRLKQPIDSLDIPVRAILWLGAYQLLMQESTAAYAAVDSSVELARRATPKAGGLVNAVLRGITRLEPVRVPAQKDATLASRLTRRGFSLDMETDLHFKPLVFPDPARALVGHLAAARSHPQAFVQHLVSVHGPDRAGEVLLRNNQRPVVTLRADAAALDVPATAGLVAHGTAERFLVAADGWNDSLERLIQKGTLSPQDPTSAKPVRTATRLTGEQKIPPPQKILDLCAGLGTKSLQLARAFPEAAVTAADVDTVKLQRLAARMKQVKQTNVSTLPLEPLEKQKSQIENVFDLVLVDVPCSNTGVFAKRVQSRWRWPTLDRGALALLQNALLKQGAAALAPKGCLIYSTCSIDPTENERRVAAFVAANPTFRLLHQETTLPSTNATTAPHDGGYFAILTR